MLRRNVLPSIERCSDHWKIISVAGWSYRTNDRGWIIYRDPQTGRWHTCAEAMAIIEAVASTPAALDFKKPPQSATAERPSNVFVMPKIIAQRA
jgi:hypothetical protein